VQQQPCPTLSVDDICPNLVFVQAINIYNLIKLFLLEFGNTFWPLNFVLSKIAVSYYLFEKSFGPPIFLALKFGQLVQKAYPLPP
jgi:hypothetical protein